MRDSSRQWRTPRDDGMRTPSLRGAHPANALSSSLEKPLYGDQNLDIPEI